jgi:hypothetical protein
VLRAAAPGLIACLAPAGLLGPAGCVALLGVSSLLSAWSIAGNYTLIADLLLADQRVAGNTVFGLAGQPSLLIGPAVAGVLAAVAGPAPRGRGDRRAVRVLPATLAGVAGDDRDRARLGLALVPLGLLAAFFVGAVIWGRGGRCPWGCSRTPARRPRWRR